MIDEFPAEHSPDFHVINFVKWRVKPTNPFFDFHKVVYIYYMAFAHLYKTFVDIENGVF